MSELPPRQPADTDGGESFDERQAAALYGYGDSGVETDASQAAAQDGQAIRDRLWLERRDAAVLPTYGTTRQPLGIKYIKGRKAVTVELPDTEERL